MTPRSAPLFVLLALPILGTGCALFGGGLPKGRALSDMERRDAIRRASVWSPTNVSTIDFKAGPRGGPSFTPDQWVTCEYKEQKMSGHSPKFTCEPSPGDEIKVKYGSRNAEVFGEVLATRLFWGLGFAADHMYPVRVRCRGCSDDPKRKPKKVPGTHEFQLAAIERKLPGRAMENREDSGWSFAELDDVGPEAPEDARTHRDALKLLVAFIQHTDSKPANQRLLCPKGEEIGQTGCRAPILMVQDLGLTFGKSTFFHKNRNAVSFIDWAEVPVWADPSSCKARLRGSFTSSVSNPRVSEAGRSFLAGLMEQISDAQLRDLFEVSRVHRRSAEPGSEPASDPPPATISEWVRLFNLKRAQIVDHRCPQ